MNFRAPRKHLSLSVHRYPRSGTHPSHQPPMPQLEEPPFTPKTSHYRQRRCLSPTTQPGVESRVALCFVWRGEREEDVAEDGRAEETH
ncbi:hypothetical protein TNCV_3827821 [Trichonephila clavipes]|nr:hypothetical protein TNCV_3827821 [Trichonephila clavipes]